MIVLKVMMSGLTPRANIAFSTSSAFPGRAGLQLAKAVITVEYLDKGAADSYGTTTSFKAVRCHSCVRACVPAGRGAAWAYEMVSGCASGDACMVLRTCSASSARTGVACA